MALFFFLPAIFHYICIRKSYPNRQSDADHSKLNGCQPITQKRSKFSNHLNFKQVYSFCRIKQYFCRIPLLLSELSDAKLMKDAQTPDPPLCGRNGKTNTMQAGGAVKIPLGKAKETE